MPLKKSARGIFCLKIYNKFDRLMPDRITLLEGMTVMYVSVDIEGSGSGGAVLTPPCNTLGFVLDRFAPLCLMADDGQTNADHLDYFLVVGGGEQQIGRNHRFEGDAKVIARRRQEQEHVRLEH